MGSIDQRRFWVLHLVLPLLLASLALAATESTSLDLWIADRWYALEGGSWRWREHWVTYDLIHHWGKVLVLAIGASLMTALALSYRRPRLRPWRMPLVYLVSAMVLLPALIARSKHYTTVACPWDLARYGGELAYQHNLAYPIAAHAGGHCFPSGHASAGFVLLAVYFAAMPYSDRPARFLMPGMLLGWIFALGQQARGAHFLSHDLWTLGLCWFGALGLYVAFRPGRWPRPGPSAESRGGVPQ